MAENLHQGENNMAKQLQTTSSGMGILQVQNDDVEEYVVQRNRIVNFVNTSKPLPNTSFTSNPPYLTMPNYQMPMHTIYPQIPQEYLTNPNAWPAATLYQPPFITIPVVESQSNQLIVRSPELPKKEVETTYPHHVDEQILRKIIGKELRSRDIQSLCYEDLCIHPNIELPRGYNIPKLNTFDGKGNPYIHLKDYCGRLIGIGKNEALLMRLFSQSLSGMALAWYTKQDFTKWHTWEDMARDFVEQYKFNIVRDPYLIDMRKIKKMPHESVAEFAVRWRLEASKMHPPLPEDELIATFIDLQEGIFYEKLLFANLKDFPSLIRYAKILEEKFQTGRLIDYDTTMPVFNCSDAPENIQHPQPSQVHCNHDMQNSSRQHRSYQAPSGHQSTKKFRPRTFTPLEESVSSIFEKLQAEGLLQPRKGTIPKHLPPHFDPLKHCAYHSNIQGHDTEECSGLRYKIQSFIDNGKIIVQEDPLSGYCSIPPAGTSFVKGEASAPRYSKKRRFAS